MELFTSHQQPPKYYLRMCDMCNVASYETYGVLQVILNTISWFVAPAASKLFEILLRPLPPAIP